MMIPATTPMTIPAIAASVSPSSSSSSSVGGTARTKVTPGKFAAANVSACIAP